MSISKTAKQVWVDPKTGKSYEFLPSEKEYPSDKILRKLENIEKLLQMLVDNHPSCICELHQRREDAYWYCPIHGRQKSIYHE